MLERQTDRQIDRENSNSNSKTSILEDSSVRSIWTYLTASTRERERDTERERASAL